MCCVAPSCSQESWTLADHRIAAARSLLTTRAAKWATKQVGGGRTITEVAKELGCDWGVVSRAVNTYGQALLDADKKRLGTITAIGFDETLFALAAVTGARRGELLGLRRSDADLDARLLTMRRSITSTTEDGVIVKGTKTGKIRRVALDDLGVQVIEGQLAELQAAAEAGFDCVADPYLFAGEPSGASTWFPDWPTHAFRKVCDDLGMGWHLHQLRHFTATQLIAAGVDVRTVSGRLGHADPGVTLRVYSHAIEAKDRDAAAIMGGLLTSAAALAPPEQEPLRSKRLTTGSGGN